MFTVSLRVAISPLKTQVLPPWTHEPTKKFCKSTEINDQQYFSALRWASVLLNGRKPSEAALNFHPKSSAHWTCTYTFSSLVLWQKNTENL